MVGVMPTEVGRDNVPSVMSDHQALSRNKLDAYYRTISGCSPRVLCVQGGITHDAL
jgi:hypothetical protein